jgi:hypothetical protein
MLTKLLGIVTVDFHIINYYSDIFYLSDAGNRKWYYNGAIHQLFILTDFKKAHNSVRREGRILRHSY